MGEKRRHMRFNVLMSALCKTSGMLKKMKINNFSREGVGILSRDPFKKGDNVEIEMIIPGDNIPVLLNGEITWASGPDSDSSQCKSGLKFKEVSNQDRSRILEHIYRRWIAPDKDEKSKKMGEK